MSENNNKNLAEYDKLIREVVSYNNRTSYSVGFLNTSCLDQDTIEIMFSRFGKVRRVVKTGDEQGYRFVHYDTIDEARRAIDLLQDDADVRPCELKNRSNKNRSNKQGYGSYSGGSNNNGHCVDHNNKEEKRATLDLGARLERARSRGSQCNLDEICSDGSASNLSQAGSMSESTGIGSKKVEEKPAAAASEHCTDSDDRSSMLSRPQTRARAVDHAQAEFTTDSDDFCSEDSKPSLMRDLSDAASVESEVSTAAEVIVANLPPDCSEAYLLYLMEEYDPLAISEIVRAGDGLDYCHVYLKSCKLAIEVERRFDGQEVYGKRLVVARPAKLV